MLHQDHLLEGHHLDLLRQQEDHLLVHQAGDHPLDHPKQSLVGALQPHQVEVPQVLQLHRQEADQELQHLQAVVVQVLLPQLAEVLPHQLDEEALVLVEELPDVVAPQGLKKHNQRNHQSNQVANLRHSFGNVLS